MIVRLDTSYTKNNLLLHVGFEVLEMTLGCMDFLEEILVCRSYKGHAHDFLAMGFEVRKSMDIRYSIKYYLCY